MFKYKIISSIAVVALTVNFFIQLKFKSADEEAIESDESIATINPVKKWLAKISDSPKSHAPEEAPLVPEVKRSQLDQSNFDNPETSSGRAGVASASRGGYAGGNTRNYSRGGSGGADNSPALIPLVRQSVPNEKVELPKIAEVDEKPTVFPVFGSSFPNSTPSPTPPLAPIIPSISTGKTASNDCASNISAGSFNNPIGITLSCSSISTIKYCMELDTGSGCCDPESSASTYTSQIVIGPKNGTYCLSYYGESDSAGVSKIYQQSYTINSTLPDLLVAHPKIYYQTGQLAGNSFINSTDFGKAGFQIGQINLKTHDPSPSGENLDCDQIMANYVTLPAPNPTAVLLSFDVSLDNPAIQIEIPLRLDQLEYGDNFITSYMANNNFVVPIYACSTSKIVLNDFEFFQNDLTFGDVGDNSVREFTGGLSPYGFFEEETVVYRGPAGVSSEDNAGQRLEQGMFGIFY